MAERPRIVFSSFRPGDDPMRDSWSRFRHAIAPGAVAGPVAGGSAPPPVIAASGIARSGIWRLLATNNRELCRSAYVYPTFDGARAHVLRLRESIDELEVVPVLGDGPGARGWYVTHRGLIVMTCGRWYGAAASCTEAAQASLAGLAEADVPTGSRDVTAPGRRSRDTGRVPELVW